jgi:hypothetical protein
VTGPGDVTPERLAELADGATPETAEERRAVALMAEVRGAAEPAPEAVRARVRAIASREAHAGTGWRRWLATGDGRRRLALAGAPVVVAIVALAVAIPVATRDDGDSAPPASADAPAAASEGAGGGAGAASPAPPEAATPQAASPAPAPPTAASTAADALRAAEPAPDRQAGGAAVTSAELQKAVDRARATLRDAGATDVRVREAQDGASATVVAAIPAGALEEATDALRAQGARVAIGGGEAPDAEGETSANVSATVTAGG